MNLFDEEDLYDVNTVGSLFKAWLRELPEEVFPLKIQEELSIAYGSEEKAPQKLRDVLSELPPWNYYLLFAITCHLSLLHAYQDKNKMTYQNLYICFAPALKMNGDCFRWLVADWRNCWKGCVTEKRYLEEEYRQIDALSSQQDHHFVAHREKEPSLSSTGSTEFRQPKPESSYHQKQHSQQKNILRSARDTTTSKAQPTRDQFKENSSSHTRLTSGREGSTSNANLTVHPNNTAMANLSLAPQKPSSSESKHHGTDSNDDEEGADASTANDAGPKINLPAAHSRSASQLPELEFPQPISPLFPSNH